MHTITSIQSQADLDVCMVYVRVVCAVMLLSQSRITREGSPRDLFTTATHFHSQRTRVHLELDTIASQLGITSAQIDQTWATLSGIIYNVCSHATVHIGVYICARTYVHACMYA